VFGRVPACRWGQQAVHGFKGTYALAEAMGREQTCRAKEDHIPVGKKENSHRRGEAQGTGLGREAVWGNEQSGRGLQNKPVSKAREV